VTAGGRTGEFVEQSYSQTFHTAVITDRSGLHVMLCHAHYPLIAFVTDRQYSYTHEFQNPPIWAGAYDDAGFEVLNRAVLLSPLTETDTSALSTAEQRQVRYWGPANLGALLFNCWD
jgi:hypothetical protein